MSKLFDNFAVFLTVVLIYVLLIFNETSIMTSLVFYEGQNSYSIYMIEFFGLKISDLFIILLTILTLVYFVKNKFLIHKYYYFIIIYSSYLLIGSIYNLLFYDHIKGFLYDFKVTLYLFVPFLLLLHLNNSKIFQFYFKLEIIFILCLASSIIDSVYIYHNFESEYPSLIGLFVLDDFIIIVIPIIIFLLQKNKLYKIFWFIIIIFLILMDINRGNLGNIYQNTLILFLFSIIFLIFNKSLTSSFIISSFHFGILDIKF